MAGAHARTSDRLEDTFYFRRTVRKSVRPEGIPRILDKLDEGDKEPPGMWPMNNKALKENAGYLLLDVFTGCFGKEVKQNARKVVCVIVRVPELVGDGIEEEVSSLRIKVIH
jgi:hypothetical protein